MERKKICIIGGGASGLMAAIMAAREGGEVTLLEHNEKTGKKLLATGNGRCNLTNTCQEPSCYHSLSGNLAWEILQGFSFQDTIRFFSQIGVYTKNREGYLYPDTYNFYVGGNVDLAFDSMLKNFNTKVYENEDFAALFEASDYSFQEIITIASLIEKETDGTDRENIASVIYNRLENAGETAYYLQIDASLVYAAGRPVTQADYETLDSPYNLYQHTGLPPTPIANPGSASIKAALQPADTDYYYYVLGADGTHVFSRTLKEHEKAKAAAEAAASGN